LASCPIDRSGQVPKHLLIDLTEESERYVQVFRLRPPPGGSQPRRPSRILLDQLAQTLGNRWRQGKPDERPHISTIRGIPATSGSVPAPGKPEVLARARIDAASAKDMKARRLLAILVTLALIGLAAWWLAGAPATVTLTREQVQQEVQKRFPLERTEFLVTGRLSDPTVILNPQTDRIGIGVSVSLSAPAIKPLTARGELEGQVRFDAQTRELYLDAPELRLTEAVGLSGSQLRTAEGIIRPLLKTLLSRIPLYRLKDPDLRFPRTNAQVQEIQVDEGRLILRFAR
jgi:hypothetical protein